MNHPRTVKTLINHLNENPLCIYAWHAMHLDISVIHVVVDNGTFVSFSSSDYRRRVNQCLWLLYISEEVYALAYSLRGKRKVIEAGGLP